MKGGGGDAPAPSFNRDSAAAEEERGPAGRSSARLPAYELPLLPPTLMRSVRQQPSGFAAAAVASGPVCLWDDAFFSFFPLQFVAIIF